MQCNANCNTSQALSLRPAAVYSLDGQSHSASAGESDVVQSLSCLSGLFHSRFSIASHAPIIQGSSVAEIYPTLRSRWRRGAAVWRAGRPSGKSARSNGDNQPVWDADGKTIVLNRPATLARWTFILDRDGKVAYKNTKADPSQSSQEVLRVLDELEKKAK